MLKCTVAEIFNVAQAFLPMLLPCTSTRRHVAVAVSSSHSNANRSLRSSALNYAYSAYNFSYNGVLDLSFPFSVDCALYNENGGGWVPLVRHVPIRNAPRLPPFLSITFRYWS